MTEPKWLQRWWTRLVQPSHSPKCLQEDPHRSTFGGVRDCLHDCPYEVWARQRYLNQGGEEL